MKKTIALFGLLAALTGSIIGANTNSVSSNIEMKKDALRKTEVKETTLVDEETPLKELSGSGEFNYDDIRIPRFLNLICRYVDDDGKEIPMRGITATCTVNVRNSNGQIIKSTKEKNAVLDGGFLISPAFISNEEGEIVIKFETDNDDIKVVNSAGTIYSYTYTHPFTRGILNTVIKTLKVDVANSDFAKAVSIFEAAYTANKLAKSLNNGNSIQKCTIRYLSGTSDGAWYSNNVISITKERNNNLTEYAAWDVIGHEYGHHVQKVFGLANNPGGTHYVDSNMSDCYYTGRSAISPRSYESARDEGIRIAYAEGWATAFSLMAQDADRAFCEGIRTCADDRYTASNGIIDISYGDYHTKKGEASEDSVIAFIWNLYDEADYENDYGDNLSLTAQEIFNLSRGCYTFSSFVNSVYNHGYDVQDVAYLLDKIKVTPSNIQISGNYYKDADVAFTWDVGGGSIYFNNNDFIIKFTNYNGTITYYSKSVHTYDFVEPVVVIDRENWQMIQERSHGQIFVSMTAYVNKGGIVTGGYVSLIQSFWAPSASIHDNQSTTIRPSDWGFSQTYTTTTTYNSFLFDDIDITTQRYRVGNNGGYTVLSPKRTGYGHASFMIEFHRYINSVDIQLAEWSRDEGIGDCEVIIETIDCEKSWKVSNVIEVRTMNIKEDGLLTYTTGIKEPIYSICISINSLATGSKNKGRICVGNITLNY